MAVAGGALAAPDTYGFANVLAWAAAAVRQRGAPITLYPVRQVDSAYATIWVQCFEIEALRRVRAATGLPVFLLLDAQADGRRALDTHGHEVDGFGASKSLLYRADGQDSGFVEQAHAAGRG